MQRGVKEMIEGMELSPLPSEEAMAKGPKLLAEIEARRLARMNQAVILSRGEKS